MILIFAGEPSEADKLQATGRLIRQSEFPPEKRGGTIYQIVPGTVDDRIAEILGRKMKAVSEVSGGRGRP